MSIEAIGTAEDRVLTRQQTRIQGSAVNFTKPLAGLWTMAIPLGWLAGTRCMVAVQQLSVGEWTRTAWSAPVRRCGGRAGWTVGTGTGERVGMPERHRPVQGGGPGERCEVVLPQTTRLVGRVPSFSAAE